MDGRFQFAFPRLTRFVRAFLIAIFAMFVLELILQRWARIPVFELLALQPADLGIQTIWQVLTNVLVEPPVAEAVGSFLLGMFFLWLMLSPFEERFGPVRTAQLTLVSVLSASLPAVVLGLIGLAPVGAFLCGTTSVSLAALAAFAQMQRGGTIYLFAVLPLKAWWVLGFSVVYALMIFLADGNSVRLVGSLGAIGGGVLFVRWMMRPRRPKKGPPPRKGSPLRVVRGGLVDPDSDRPKYLN